MNPFELFDLDPSLGLAEITQQLRERMEGAATEEERDTLRKAWETLTLVPQDRFRLALSTPPSSGERDASPHFESSRNGFGIDVLNEIDFINLCE